MIMARFKTTFVATLLLYFSYSFVIGRAQQYEHDYSAEARVSNWQSSRTRSSDAPSRFDVKNSSPDVAVRSRPRSRSRYEGDGIAAPEAARKYTVEQTERAQIRGRQRTRQRIPIERRVDDVTHPAPVPTRRRPNRVTESTTQATDQFISRLRVPMEDTLNQPRGFTYSRDGTVRSRQRVKEEISETSTTATPRPFSRGRVKAKMYDIQRRPSKADDISESDNYPPGFIEKIKNPENREEDAAPRRSRLRQRAAKTYPAIALSEANRFRPLYTRPTTESSQTEVVPEETTTRRNPVQRSRNRYTTPRVTTDHSPKPFRRRLSSTEKNDKSATAPTTTISPRQKYLSRLRTVNRPFKPSKVIQDKTVEDEKEEALEPAENAFYVHPEDAEEQKLKNVNVDLESDASEESERVEMEKTSERPTTITTTAATTPTTKAAASVPATRHRFSSRFSRSNKTTPPEEVERSTPPSDSLVLDSVTSAPINLTSLFDDSPDSTLSIKALFNNFNASSSVATNKTNSPETLTNITTTTKTSTTRPSTVTENSSTATKGTMKKKSQKKSRKASKVSTTTADGLSDRPILRNIMSLFGSAETTSNRTSGKKKSSRGRTTTSATTPGPKEIEKIQTIINETMEVIHNRSGGPSPARLVPRLALNALTPETSTEETITRPTATATTTATTTAASTTKTTTTTIAAETTTAKTTTSAPKITTTSKTTTSTKKSSSSASKSAALSEETPKKNCTSQFVYFDYNSNTPIPQQYSNLQQNAKAKTTTTTSTTADYFVYGVYPNNTIVRKRAWKTFDYEKYHSPYVIFGIYPNNTIVKKFPNGTVINDEFMTSDNEIRDIMGLPRTTSTTTTTKKPETTTTTTKNPTTATTIKPETTRMENPTTTTRKQESATTKKPETTTATEMRMAGSATTENKIEEMTTEEESPDSMFEIFENEIERLEREDEQLGSSTTEATPATTISDEDIFDDHYITGRTTTDQRSAESIESTTPSFSIIEKTRDSTKETTPGTTESITPATLKSSREGKSFSFNDIFGEEILDSTTERASTTGSSLRETTEPYLFAGLSDEVDSDVSTTTERTVGTTDSKDGYLDLQQIVQSTTMSDDSSRSFDIDIRLGDDPAFRPPTTEAGVEEGSTRFWSTTTEFPSTPMSVSDRLVESTTTESLTTSKTRFDSFDGDLFGTILRGPTTTRSVSNNLVESTTTEVPTTPRSLFGSTTTETPTAARSLFGLSESDLFGSTTTETPISTLTEVPTTLRSLFGLSERNLFESTTKSIFRSSGSTPPVATTTEVPTTTKTLSIDNFQQFETTSGSVFGLSRSDLFGSATTEERPASGGRLVEPTTTEVPTTLRSLFGRSEANLFGATSTETVLTTTVTERRNSEEATTASNAQNEFLLDGDLFQLPEVESSVTKSTMRDDEQPGIVNLAYRALGSSNTITTAPTPTLNYITSTMKSTNYKEKKVRMKMKRTSTTTPKSENVFIVTPETTVSGTDYGRKGKVKFVTLTPGVIVTTDVRDENDVITMSSQHVQKVTKAPANIPDNVLTSVVGEIQQKSSSPIPDILKNVEKELQGNGISVSLARRIIEMAIERAVTTEIPETTNQIRETTFTAPYTTTRRAPTTTTAYTTPTSYRTESTTFSNEISTTYNDLINTINVNPLSVGFAGDYTESITKKVNEDEINRVVQGLWKEQTQTTTIRTTTTTKTSKRTKSSRNPSATATTLSQNDKLLLEAILKQQNSNLSVQELDKIIENQIRLAEEVRKASKNMKKPRVTTTTTTTTQTPPLFGFLISLFSGNSSPSNIPVTRSPIKQTRSRQKSSRGPGSMPNPKKPDPFKEAELGKPSGERSTRGELVTAAIDVTKAVSKFMGTFLSSAAQSFQAFFSNFGRGR